MKTNQDYKNAALEALKGNWATAVVATIVLVAMALLMSSGNAIAEFGFSPATIYTISGVSWLLNLFVMYPLLVGIMNGFKKLYFENDTDLVSNEFRLGFSRWLHNVWGMFLMNFFTMLWTFLFIIPGLIKSYAYAMTPYILSDNPELSANQAINRSIAMMRGHKFDLFYLHLSFIGWALLSILTCGIGFLWLFPYIQTSQASFYADIKSQYEAD